MIRIIIDDHQKLIDVDTNQVQSMKIITVFSLLTIIAESKNNMNYEDI